MEEKNLENRIGSLETKFEVFVQEMRDFKDEMRDFKTEMRDRDNQRAAEIRELRQQREKDNAKHDAAMVEVNKKIDDKFDKISNQIVIMSVSTILGVGAIVWAVVSALK